MHQPDTIGSERRAEGDIMGMLVRGVGFVGVDVAVDRFAVVAVSVGVEVPAPPANEQPRGEDDYDHTDQSLRNLLHRPRQVTAQQHERKADENQGRAVPNPPGKTHRAGLSHPVTTFGGDEGGNRRQVIRVGGVAQTQRQAYQEYDPEGRRPVQEALEPTVYRRHILSLPPHNQPLSSGDAYTLATQTRITNVTFSDGSEGEFSGSPQRRPSNNVRTTLKGSPYEGEHRRTAQSEGSTMGIRWREEERSCLTRRTLWMEAGCTSRTTAAMEPRSSCTEG